MKSVTTWVLLSIYFLMPSLSTAATDVKQNTPVIPLAPGYGKLGYSLADVGSYNLPVLKNAPDGKVLDEKGKPVQLHDLYQGKYTLLSFIYSNCKDVNGLYKKECSPALAKSGCKRSSRSPVKISICWDADFKAE